MRCKIVIETREPFKSQFNEPEVIRKFNTLKEGRDFLKAVYDDNRTNGVYVSGYNENGDCYEVLNFERFRMRLTTNK